VELTLKLADHSMNFAELSAGAMIQAEVPRAGDSQLAAMQAFMCASHESRFRYPRREATSARYAKNA
jgi:hypothetical protein